MKYRSDLSGIEAIDPLEASIAADEDEELLPEELDRSFKGSEGPASTNYIVQQIFEKVVGIDFAKYVVTVTFEARQVLTGNIVGKELRGLKIESKKSKSNLKAPAEAPSCLDE